MLKLLKILQKINILKYNKIMYLKFYFILINYNYNLKIIYEIFLEEKNNVFKILFFID